MLLLIDNYDSFTYNLFQYLSELGEAVVVTRNDKMSLAEMEKLAPERLPILGVCLGHQCIGHSYGGTVGHAGEIKHGKSSLIHHDGRGVFTGLANPFPAIRYHSLAVMRDGLPDCLEVSAWTENGLIMGLRHRRFKVEGVQFHPESILTDVGKDLLRNFLTMFYNKDKG